MKKSTLINRFFTNNNRFSKDSPSYRRAYLLNIVLAVLLIVCIYYTAMNMIKTDTPVIIYIDGTAAILTACAIYYFHKTDNMKNSTILVIILLTITLACFIFFVENKAFGLYWCAIYSPVVYFLLGRKNARIINICFSLAVFLYILFRYGTWGPVEFGIEAISNITVATVCLSLLISYYERSRRSVEEALAQKNSELALLAVTDCLTGLYNRSKIDSVISEQLDICRKEKRTFSLILGDIDYFKNINDTYGHTAGDKIIIDISKILMCTCREVDTVSRWGGDEYLVICPDTDESEIRKIKDGIMDKVEAYNVERNTAIAMSLGTATYAEGDTADIILNRADKALYDAKVISHSHPED